MASGGGGGARGPPWKGGVSRGKHLEARMGPALVGFNAQVSKPWRCVCQDELTIGVQCYYYEFPWQCRSHGLMGVSPIDDPSWEIVSERV